MSIRPLSAVAAVALAAVVFAEGWAARSVFPPRVPMTAAPGRTGSDPTAVTQAFQDVYKNGVWGVDAEGRGTSGSATPLATKVYTVFLQDLLKTAKIRSVVDAGCGQFGQSGLIDWTGIDYRGFDIVADVIDRDRQKYERPNVHFFVANVIDADLPPADLLICNYVLQHLPIADVTTFLAKQVPKYRYVIISNTVDRVTLTADNREIAPGEFRPLDITRPPFSVKGRKVLTYFDDPSMQQVVYLEGHP